MRRVVLTVAFGLLTLAALWRPTFAQNILPGPSVTCAVVNNSGTSLAAFTGTGCAGNDGQTALYITDITASSSVIATTTGDQYLELKYGSGTNCGTGTVVLWAAYNLAWAAVPASFRTPLKVPAGKDLCWMHAATGSKTFIVSGFLGAP